MKTTKNGKPYGRPVDPAKGRGKQYTIYLYERQKEAFDALGGSVWLQNLLEGKAGELQEFIARRTKG